MPTGDLIKGLNGEPVMEAGVWAKDKLYYIQSYCDIFNKGMKNKWSTRTYIDLFSGPGRCKSEETQEEFDGSPVIALKCRVPFTHYFFNELNKDSLTALKNRASSFTSVDINYFNMDCNEVIDHLLPKLPSNSLDFCFIDPTNWQIKFDSIRRLAEGRKMDLAITFHVGAIKRCAEDAPEELDDFFGDCTWREEYRNMIMSGRREGSRVLLNAYEQRIRGLGYEKRDIQDWVLVRGPKNIPLYYLIFASRHSLGKEFWDKISLKSPSGQIRMTLPEV